jgi:hypothetical protein
MSTRQEGAPSHRVRSRDDLVAWIADGSKPKADWRIGTEHEKFVFHTDTLTPVAYEGDSSISALMKALPAAVPGRDQPAVYAGHRRQPLDGVRGVRRPIR